MSKWLLILWFGLCAVALALSPALADFGLNRLQTFWSRPPVKLYAAACVQDDNNLTTYDFGTITITGVAAGTPVLVVLGIVAEDNATVHSISSATIDGSAATEINDEDGTGEINSGIYTSVGRIYNADSVAVTVTFSEAMTAAGVCVWALENVVSTTPTASVIDDDTASGALVLTLNPTVGLGYALGICATSLASATTTWAVLTERQETPTPGDLGFAFSNADARPTGASMSVTCDWSGTNDATGAAAAFR